MTDQCFDEPDRGREPTTLSVNTTDDSTTYSYTLPEEWIRINTGVIRNTASKLELAKKAIRAYYDEVELEIRNAESYYPGSSICVRLRNILELLED